MNDVTTIDTASTEPVPHEDEVLSNEISDEFYIVSRKKFITLYFCTLGFYSVYWFYKNWKLQKILLKESYWTIMRGIFYIFFTHDLLKKIDKKLKNPNKKYYWDHNGISTQIVILTIASNISGRLAMKYIGSPYTDILSLVLTATIGVLLLKAQEAVNLACNDPEGTSNNQISGLNIFWIVAGLILTALSILGIFVTDANT